MTSLSVRATVLTAGLSILIVLAASGCSESGGRPAKKVDVPALLQKLKSADADEKTGALTELAEGGPNAAPAVPALIELLKDGDPLVRRLSGYVLYEIGLPGAASALAPVKEAMSQEQDRLAYAQFVNTVRILDPKNAGDVKGLNVTQ